MCTPKRGKKSAYEHITKCSDIKSKAIVFLSARALTAFVSVQTGVRGQGDERWGHSRMLTAHVFVDRCSRFVDA